MKVLFVGLGGFVGAVARYALSGAVQRLSASGTFPWGTLAVNVLGCALIGLLAAGADARGFFRPEMRALVFIGVLGGFTTFSTFAYETLALGRDADTVRAAANVGVTVVGCLAAAWLGSALGRAWWAGP